MRRLIAWTVSLIGSASLILLSLRGSDPAACIRFFDEKMGNVLTVDINTQRMQLDSRTNLPVLARESGLGYVANVSPDKRYVLDTYNAPESGPSMYDLVVGPRSTGSRRLRKMNGDNPAIEYAWSPTSTHLAFTELRAWNGNQTLVNLVITDVKGQHIQREPIPDLLDDDWLQSDHPFNWSPDGSILSLPGFRYDVGATLIVRAINADRTSYVSFPGEKIAEVSWSPMGAVALVATESIANDPAFHKVYFVTRDGAVLNQITLDPDYPVHFDNNTLPILMRHWSPDGQYVWLGCCGHIDVFDQRGNRAIPTQSSVGHPFWAALPHTLVYLTKQADRADLVALDAATGQTRLLVPDIATDVRESRFMWFSPDEPAFVIAARGKHGGITPYFLSVALDTSLTPFGEIATHQFFPAWSSDGRKLTFVAEHAADYVLMWWDRATGAMQQYHMARRGTPTERQDVDWLTNDVMLFTDGEDLVLDKTQYLLNTRTLQLIPLVPDFIGSGNYKVTAYNDAYLTMSTPTGFSFYDIDMGQLILSVPLPTDYPSYLTYPDPALQSVLIRGKTTLYLGTANTMDKITEQAWTPPVWSLDGTMFAYGEWSYDGWMLNIFSRAAVLLKRFSVQLANFDADWDEVRWTNCD